MVHQKGLKLLWSWGYASPMGQIQDSKDNFPICGAPWEDTDHVLQCQDIKHLQCMTHTVKSFVEGTVMHDIYSKLM